MPQPELRCDRPVGEKSMRLTVVGGIVIIAAVIAALVILRLSQTEHSVALPHKVNPNERPDTGWS
jgi:hypothetical protein